MKRLLLFLVIPALLMFMITGCGGGQQASTEQPNKGATQQPSAESEKVFTFKMAGFASAGHIAYKTEEFIIQRLDELSNGRMKVEHYPAGQLGAVADMLQLASAGTADIALLINLPYAGQIPLNTVMSLPFYTTSVEGTEIYSRLVKSTPELDEELAKYGVRRIALYTTPQYDVGTASKPVKSPEDLKGLTLSSTGGILASIAAKYGVNVRNVVAGEIYEAMQKGIVEGAILSYATVGGYKISELEKYHTKGLRMGADAGSFIMNEKSFQKLPEELQNIVLEVGEEASRYFASLWDEQTDALAEQFQSQGMEIYTIPAEERAAWDAKLEGIEDEWIKTMNDKGLPGQKVFDEFYKFSKEVAK